MKAIVATRYGSTEDVVELQDRPTPTPAPTELLIEVRAASVNPIDFKIQRGDLKRMRKLSFPFALGFDVSGVVKAVGNKVTQFKVGDEVFSRVGPNHMGTFAEFVTAEEQHAARKPANVTHQEAAALPLVALTSWQAMFDRAQLKPGQKVLIHAGAGGIGSVAIQLAKQHGAYVASTTSTANVERVRELGADLVIDYTKTRYEDVVRDYDVVFETLGGENQRRSFGVLKRGGVLVSIVGMPTSDWARRQGLPLFLRLLLGLMNRGNDKLAKAHGVSWDMVLMEPSGRQLALVAQLVENGKLKPIVDRVFPLSQTREALIYSQSGRAKGKIVIEVVAG